MFQFFEIPSEAQDRQACYFFKDYIKCLYVNPNPILNNWHPEPTWVTERFRQHDGRIKDFPVRSEDVWIVSYPKTGTTLTCEMVSVLLSGIDFGEVEKKDILRRVHFLELSALSQFTPDDYIQRAMEDPNQRIIKTHLQMNLLPKEFFSSAQKVIYVVRNPKDAAISQYHHHRNMHGYEKPLNDFLDDFLVGELPFGSYFRHVEEFSQLVRQKENFLMISYEKMIENMPKVVEEVASFLGMSLEQEEILKVSDYLSFDKMKERPGSNMQEITELSIKDAGRKSDFKFMRKGKVNSYKEEMPQEYIKKMDEEIRKWKEVNDLYSEK